MGICTINESMTSSDTLRGKKCGWHQQQRWKHPSNHAAWLRLKYVGAPRGSLHGGRSTRAAPRGGRSTRAAPLKGTQIFFILRALNIDTGFTVGFQRYA